MRRTEIGMFEQVDGFISVHQCPVEISVDYGFELNLIFFYVQLYLLVYRLDRYKSDFTTQKITIIFKTFYRFFLHIF